jgi:hypothetical protein
LTQTTPPKPTTNAAVQRNREFHPRRCGENLSVNPELIEENSMSATILVPFSIFPQA